MSPTEYEMQLKAAMHHLSRHDPVLAPLIAAIGMPTFRPHTDYYWELVDAIISQQLSIKAAATIEQRLLNLFDGQMPRAEQLLTKTPDQLRAIGLSGAKAGYVLDLAAHIASGQLAINQLPTLPNDEIIHELTAIKGIGEWTAHMFLIFALGRLDVLPVGDLGFKNAVRQQYKLSALPSPAEMQAIAAKNHWQPYQSVATWYLWQSLTLQTETS